MKDFVPHIAVTSILVILSIFFATYFSKDSVFKRDFISVSNSPENITSIQVNLGYDKTRANKRFIAKIFDNINIDSERGFGSNDTPIGIVVYIKGQMRGGLTFYISRNGWGYDPLGNRFHSYFDKALGAEFYNTLFKLIKASRE